MCKSTHWLLIALLLFAASAQAELKLDNALSSLHFISIKKDKIGEVHSFERLSGSISDKGVASVSIALVSVKTNIDVRDGRMKSLLLETDVFPEATVSANLGAEQLASISVGDISIVSVELMLDLHGVSKVIPLDVQVVGLNNGAILVSTIKPIMLYASDFGLEGGIQKLMEAAKLPSIASAVPVSFSLVFKQQ